MQLYGAMWHKTIQKSGGKSALTIYLFSQQLE
jgi:hypothetical protein